MVTDSCFFNRSVSRDETRLPLKPSRDAPAGDDKVELLPISISAANVSSNVGLVQVLRELRQFYSTPADEEQYKGYRVFVADVAIYKRILKVDFEAVGELLKLIELKLAPFVSDYLKQTHY